MSPTSHGIAEAFPDPRDQRVPLAVPMSTRIGNPLPIGVGLLAFQLLLFAAEWFDTSKSTFGASGIAQANTYSVLVASLGQFVAGIICYFRGEGYRAQILSMFGLWLFGFFLLAKDASAPPLSAAWFFFGLILPLAIIMIPAILHGIWPFVIAFFAIIVMCIVGGIGFISANRQAKILEAKGTPDFGTAVNLLHVAAILALITVVALVWLMVEELLREHGVLQPREH